MTKTQIKKQKERDIEPTVKVIVQLIQMPVLLKEKDQMSHLTTLVKSSKQQMKKQLLVRKGHEKGKADPKLQNLKNQKVKVT